MFTRGHGIDLSLTDHRPRICGMIRARPGEVIELQAVGWIHNCSAQAAADAREEGEPRRMPPLMAPKQ